MDRVFPCAFGACRGASLFGQAPPFAVISSDYHGTRPQVYQPGLHASSTAVACLGPAQRSRLRASTGPLFALNVLRCVLPTLAILASARTGLRRPLAVCRLPDS